MTERLKYMLELGVTDGANVEEIEELLQQLLLDLYEQGEVESIRVTKDDHVSDGDEDIAKMLDVIETVDSESIRKAIDSVKRLEDTGDDDDE